MSIATSTGTTERAPRIEATRIGKRYCRDARRSLRYALADLGRGLVGRGRPEALRPGEFWALTEVSFRLEAGECLGVLGPNGAGKSTLLRLVQGRLPLDAGSITVRGRLASVSDLGLGFDAALSGRDNARHMTSLLGVEPRHPDSLLDSVFAFAELEGVADAPVASYSAGMRARLGFAVAAHLEPDLLLIDEALAVGDVAFRRKCMRHLTRLAASGRSLVIVSHDLYALQVLCPRALYVDSGRLLFDGATDEAIERYLASLRPAAGPAPDRPLSEARPVVIEEVELRAPGGGAPVTGERAEVVVRYRAERPIPSIPWFFQVASADLMVEIGTGVGALEEDEARIEAGRGELVASVPRLPLLAGTYGLRAAVVDPWERTVLALFGYEESPAFFEVRAPSSGTARLLTLSHALVEIETERPSLSR